VTPSSLHRIHTGTCGLSDPCRWLRTPHFPSDGVWWPGCKWVGGLRLPRTPGGDGLQVLGFRAFIYCLFLLERFTLRFLLLIPSQTLATSSFHPRSSTFPGRFPLPCCSRITGMGTISWIHGGGSVGCQGLRAVSAYPRHYFADSLAFP